MSNELTDVRCPCGAEFQADSYDAGFIAGSGMCQNCDAALPPKDICTCPSGDGSLRWPCPKHPAVEHERAEFEAWVRRDWPGAPLRFIRDALPVNDPRYGQYCDDALQRAWVGWQARAALAQPSPVSEALIYACKNLAQITSSDGSGHADIAMAVLRMAGVGDDERERLVNEWKAARAWKPSPAQAEQAEAEAERPEVVAYFDRNYPSTGDAFIWSNYEGSPYEPVMTVAQHERIVKAWIERWKAYIELSAKIAAQRDAALARVAELEKQEPVALANRGIHAFWVKWTEAAAGLYGPGIKLYAHPVAQAQHSVPEEFSFEYRHPNGECHTVTVSREQVINEMPDFLFEALCSKFCNCEPVGETNVVECCCDEYAEEFKLIAAAPGKEGL